MIRADESAWETQDVSATLDDALRSGKRSETDPVSRALTSLRARHPELVECRVDSARVRKREYLKYDIVGAELPCTFVGYDVELVLSTDRGPRVLATPAYHGSGDCMFFRPVGR